MVRLKGWFPILLGFCFFLLAAITYKGFNFKDTAIAFAETGVTSADLDCTQYPHWDCNNPALQRIDNFIKTYKDTGYVAAMDWDGTLYSETITIKQGDIHAGTTRSGQSVWHLWAAQRSYFPAFNTKDGDRVGNIVRWDDYLEGKTNVSSSSYSKFSQIATFEMGMTPQEMHSGVQEYLNVYPTGDYAYLKMMDVLQQFVNNGFQVWIITGSNPYFIVSLLNHIDQTLGYNLLTAGCDPGNPDLEQCRIVGNAAKQSPDGRFTMVYDDRFVRISDSNNPFFLERNIIDGG